MIDQTLYILPNNHPLEILKWEAVENQDFLSREYLKGIIGR